MRKPITTPRWTRAYRLASEKGVQVQTIYRWIREGKIPADRVRRVTIVTERIEIDASFPLEQTHRRP